MWNLLILEDDELFPIFLVPAFLKYYEKVIHYFTKEISECESTQLPSLLSNCNISSKKQADKLFEIALDLRFNTPYSFRMLARFLGINSKNEIYRLKLLNNFFKPEKILNMPIFSSEVLFIAFKSIFRCPDFQCDTFKSDLKKFQRGIYHENLEIEEVEINFPQNVSINLDFKDDTLFKISENDFKNLKKSQCFYCRKLKYQECQISFVFVDLRPQINENNLGMLPKTIIIDEKEVLTENVNI